MKIELVESYPGEADEPGKLDAAVKMLYEVFGHAGGDESLTKAADDGAVDGLLELEAVITKAYDARLEKMRQHIMKAVRKR